MNTYAKKMVALPFAMLFALTLTLIVAQGVARAQDRPLATQSQLDQILAPIALYPDALLSQILMAATYPLEVVEAARWSRSNPGLVGEDAVRAAERENWDPSVKSLLAFPQVLSRMDENLQWTQALGDAFLDQEPQVMDTVQSLRRRALAAGNLRSDERQSVVEYGPTVVVQPVNPQIVYVPYYDPMVVYGPWWWPEYRPVYWRPFPGYYAQPGFAASFFWGPSIRISAGFFFGGFDWPRREARVVQVNYYYNNGTVSRRGDAVRDRAPGAWQHDPEHRRGVAYRSAAVQQRFAGAVVRPDARQSESRPETGARVYPRSERRSVTNPIAAQPSTMRPAAQSVVQPAAQPALQPQVNVDARTERREQGNRAERGGQNGRAERGPDARAANVTPQAVESRNVATPIRRDPAPRIETPRVNEPRPEPRREPATRIEAPRAVEVRPATPHAQPEAHREADVQRGARAEDAARRPREQR